MGTPSYDASTLLFQDGPVTVGSFDCRPHSAMWREPAHVSEGCVFVFPAAPVRLATAAERLLADRSRVIFHQDGKVYRRRLAYAEDDACLFMRVDADEVRRLVELAAPGATGPSGRALPLTDGPIDHQTYGRQRLLRAVLESGGRIDRRAVRSSVDTILLAAVAASLAGPVSPPRRRPSPAHHALAEDVRLTLGTNLRDHLTNAEVGARHGYSPFHLARVFRAATGMSMHDYRLRIRLRGALDRVARGAPDLSSLADELGFASHSHLTGQFHRAFGLPPAVLRKTMSLPLR